MAAEWLLLQFCDTFIKQSTTICRLLSLVNTTMFKSIFNKISDYSLIIIEDAAFCLNSKLFDILPGVVKNDNVQVISAPCAFKIPNLCQQVDDKSEIIIIESINPYLWTHGLLKVAQDLKKIENGGKILIVNLQTDTLLNEEDAVKLRYLSSAHIKIVQKLGQQKFLIKISTKRKHQIETIEIDKNGGLTNSIVTREIEKPAVTSNPILTTFNLGVNLSENEKLAKDALILPYLRNKQENSAIIYNADDADLEEDPDEDLEL